ncbi:uncharacterized protein LOC132904400 [Amyelois transitella]|uniref:uncharacterized protein LOC132904400 n=1 Tax=Amyelois transitella TaxID=680683 RepID=UPI00299002F0|nr:uncharacterized protein LOC132904400 [Amyelois transitella]
MVVQVLIEGVITHLISAYAPQSSDTKSEVQVSNRRSAATVSLDMRVNAPEKPSESCRRLIKRWRLDVLKFQGLVSAAGDKCAPWLYADDIAMADSDMGKLMCGVSCMKDRVRNSHIRGNLHVRDIVDKIKENRLCWYGHVLRKTADYLGCRRLARPLPPGPGRRGAPKDDMRVNGLKSQDAVNWTKWRE